MQGLEVNDYIRKHVSTLKTLCSGVIDNSVIYKQQPSESFEYQEEVKVKKEHVEEPKASKQKQLP